MNKKAAYFLFLLIALTSSCSDDESLIENSDSLTEDRNTSSSQSVEEEILNLVNAHRQSIGLSTISINNTARDLAIDHTNYMIAQRRISHDNFDQRFEDIQNVENAITAAENVADGYPTAQAVVEGWLNSSGHRRNIEGNYTHIGIAAIQNSQGRYYYTQFFYR